MDLRKIQNQLNKYNISHFNEINSTHKYVKENYNNLKDRTVILADMQSNGIGTHGRVWYTGRENNIAMSILIKPNCNIENLKNITTKIASSIQKAINEMYNINLEIKFPNDLLLNSKKICGVLTEINTISEKVNYLIISIGFNVNETHFDEETANIATSLKKEYNQNYSREDIIIKIIENIENEILINLTSQNNENFY